MKTANLLLPLLALLLTTDASAITKRKACRLACGWKIDQCVADGGRKLRCRRHIVRDCKRFGLEFCTPPTPTTTTLPPIITPTTSTTIHVVPTTSTTTSTVLPPTTTSSTTTSSTLGTVPTTSSTSSSTVTTTSSSTTSSSTSTSSSTVSTTSSSTTSTTLGFSPLGTWSFTGTLVLNDCDLGVSPGLADFIVVTTQTGADIAGTVGGIPGSGTVDTGATQWELFTAPDCDATCCLITAFRAFSLEESVTAAGVVIVADCGALQCTVGWVGTAVRQ